MRPTRVVAPLRLFTLLCIAALVLSTGCATKPKAAKPGTPLKRTGDEIMVAGQLFHIGTPVVLWTDPGGFDAYRTERRFAPWEEASFRATTQAATTRPKLIDIGSPSRVRLRSKVLTPEEIEQVRGGGWPL